MTEAKQREVEKENNQPEVLHTAVERGICYSHSLVMNNWDETAHGKSLRLGL